MVQQFWHIRNCSLFQRLNERQLEFLEQKARIKEFPKGASVYLPSDLADGTFLVAKGRIRIGSTTPEGKHCILGFVEPGEVFGELALVDGGTREERAEAAVASTLVVLPSDHVKALMEHSANLSLGVSKLIGMRRKRIERRLRSLLFRNNRDRLTHLLLELAEQYGNATTSGIELTIRLSHQDLAAIIGATRETVTTLLGEMQSEGLLIIKRQRLILADLAKLASEEQALSNPAIANAKSKKQTTLQRGGNSTPVVTTVPCVTKG
ncbi:MAG: Crp/Fnr family transcriptional regulator [Planctomycetota bacterium]